MKCLILFILSLHCDSFLDLFFDVKNHGLCPGPHTLNVNMVKLSLGLVFQKFLLLLMCLYYSEYIRLDKRSLITFAFARLGRNLKFTLLAVLLLFIEQRMNVVQFTHDVLNSLFVYCSLLFVKRTVF